MAGRGTENTLLDTVATGKSAESTGPLSSAGKVLALLDAFGVSRAVLGVSELATRAQLSKSTAHRLLGVLVERDYVQRIDDRYCLTDRMFVLGNQVRICRPNGLRERAVPFMTELFAETRETVHLAVLHGTEVLYLEKIFGHGAAPCSTTVGTRRPVHCTALGKALVAFADEATVHANLTTGLQRFTRYTLVYPKQLQAALARVHQEGVATDLEEYKLGVTCIAAPVREPATGQAVAALSISSVTSRGDVRRHKSRIIRAAEALSDHLAMTSY
ncbi:IclR family transcriptional regulator [Streptomyces sp. Y7]|uniref:IclR family transcriptional regulator n=1 Tax=Streptomyces sp. Y7 TaxID=3342392 RepID=UPI003724553E